LALFFSAWRFHSLFFALSGHAEKENCRAHQANHAAMRAPDQGRQT